MNRKSVGLLVISAIFVAGLSMWWLSHSAVRAGKENLATASTHSPLTEAGKPAPSQSAVSSPAMPATTAARIEEIRGQLIFAADADSARKLLKELRALLDALPPKVASQEVQAFLGLQQDAATKLDVTVQSGGKLGDASSLRVFLLDYLGQIDRPAAANLGRAILSTPTSPDEWAVSLRNVAWADDSPATRGYLQSKAREMISNPAWRKDPSAGFLEAFDVIVHARGFELTPQLTEFVRDREHRGLGHAAYLTLDRLTLTDPTAALGPLVDQPDLMAGREQTRANFFARLDVRDEAQKVLLEKYLLDARRTPQELQTFAGIFPNANFMVSNNLLTPTNTPDHAELTARDRVTLQVVEAWLADPRFSQLQPNLQAVRGRLKTFVEQAASPSPR